MKGAPGLLIAVGLGIVGAFCNWVYLAQKGQELERLDFIGIDENVKINAGDKFNEAQFMKISVPKNAVGNLDNLKRAIVQFESALPLIDPVTDSAGWGDAQVNLANALARKARVTSADDDFQRAHPIFCGDRIRQLIE